VDCDAYLANARRIFCGSGKSPDQSAGRAIVHAAYYSIFHFVAQRLNMDVTGQDAAKHSDLKRRLVAYVGPDSAMNEAKRHFATLQRARVDADYSLKKDLEPGNVVVIMIYKAAGITPTIS
jgi:hypothetical protein